MTTPEPTATPAATTDGGVETQLAVVVEVLDQERVIQVDHHRQVVTLRKVVIAEVCVEQDPVVAVRLIAEALELHAEERLEGPGAVPGSRESAAHPLDAALARLSESRTIVECGSTGVRALVDRGTCEGVDLNADLAALVDADPVLASTMRRQHERVRR